jgi:hypothetical protein
VYNLVLIAGGGVQTFVHSDIRLRGFSSLSTVSYEVLTSPDNIERRHDDEYSSLNVGYRAVYRLLCGGGYGVFTLWQVCLMAEPLSISPHNSTDEISFKYTQVWEVLQTGSVNAPSMSFGLVIEGEQICEGAKRQCIEFILQGLQKDARIYSVFVQVNHSSSTTAGQLSIMETDDNLTSTTQNSLQNVLKGRNLRGLINVQAGSADGMIIFTGIDELIVYRYYLYY